jgi:hypothetical protein
MRNVVLGVVLAVLMPHGAIALELREDPGGFYGTAWATPIAEMPRLELVEDNGELKTYKMPGPPPAIGGAAVEAIWYRFYKGKLESVQIRYSGKETHQLIRAWAAERLGPLPPTHLRGLQEFTWVGQETTILLQFDKIRDRGTLFFTSRVLQAELGATIPLE